MLEIEETKLAMTEDATIKRCPFLSQGFSPDGGAKKCIQSGCMMWRQIRHDLNPPHGKWELKWDCVLVACGAFATYY